MPSGERSSLVSGALSSDTDGAPRAPKVNKFRGLICWGIFAAFLVFFIIMTAVYTDPKSYEAATPDEYLSGEDRTLYEGLGQIYFKPSTQKMNALAYCQLGLQLMHVFWYDLAIQKFQQARTMDPKLAVAYWGEAMCYKQPLWQSENVTAAQAVLAQMDKAVNASALSDRDEDYIAAARALFAVNSTLQARETKYSELMQAICSDSTDDADACALAGLSLLGQLQSTGNYLTPEAMVQVRYNAKEILGKGIHDYPGHAGMLHYQVHLYDVDDLEAAEEGEDPALALAKAAPASNVAQHMRSHIFARFGNWSQVVDSNKAAVVASNSYCSAIKGGYDCDADNRWHALEWQLYGETQQCAFTAASASYVKMQTVAANMSYADDYGQWLYRTYAHLQLQSMNSLGAIPLMGAKDNATSMMPRALYDTNSILDAGDIGDHFWPPHAEAHALLARVYSLVSGRNATQQQAAGVNETLTAALARLDVIVAAQNNLTAAADDPAAMALNSEMTALLTTVQLQARALVAAAACAVNNTARCADWVPLMDQALALHNNFSKSSTLPTLKIAPTPEFYGNLLLATNATTANAMFEACLSQLPGRLQCVLGSARALARMEDVTKSRTMYSKLVAQCSSGDSRFPPLAEARKVLGLTPPPPAKKGLRRALQEEQAVGAMAA